VVIGLLVLILPLILCIDVGHAAGTTYYVDSVDGNDSNDGLTPASPWKSLSKVNAQVFAPGDHILFKAGSYFMGQLKPQGSGSSGNPIAIDMYGTGNKPIFDGGGVTGEGVVVLHN